MTHAIGDLAVAQVLRVSKRFSGRRLRVEHNELVIPEELEADEVGPRVQYATQLPPVVCSRRTIREEAWLICDLGQQPFQVSPRAGC